LANKLLKPTRITFPNKDIHAANKKICLEISRKYISEHLWLLSKGPDGEYEVTPENIKLYKKILSAIPSAVVADVIEPVELDRYKTHSQSQVAIIEGEILEPRLLGFKGLVTESKNFLLYWVKIPHRMNQRSIGRITECQARDING
jgi:hypothetical protein